MVVRLLHCLLVLVLLGAAPVTFAKKGKPATDDTAAPSPASNVDSAKAELAATLALANIKVSRIALDEDTTLADVKPTVSPIYDRQESATKAGLDKLRAAGSDKTKVASAVDAINAADDEAVKYFKANPTPGDRINKRVTLINAEIGQITKTPDAYCGMLEKVGVSGDALMKAKGYVKDAAPKKASGKGDPEGTGAGLTARTQVHQLMSARQLKALDGVLAGR